VSDDLIAICPSCGFLIARVKPKDVARISARRCRGRAMVIGKSNDQTVLEVLVKRKRALKINEAFGVGR